jgi:hypothetical protein
MVAFLSRLLLVLRASLRSSARREAEILVLRQQLLVLSRKSSACDEHPRSPRGPALAVAE